MEMVDRHSRRPPNSQHTWPSGSGNPTQIGDGEPDRDHGGHVTRLGSYEELYCSSRASVPLVGTLVTSSGQQSDVVKQGYLGKLERSRRRYFVLRAGSHTGPSRLEWYKSQEKFAAMEKSFGKAVLFGPSKQGVIYLRCCIGVGCLGSSRKGLTVALYAQDQTMLLVAEDQQDQEGWYQSIKKVMTEEREDEERGCDDEDDGYCTLPPAAFFKEVWPVSVKPQGLGRSKSLAGELRLCLTATSLILVRVGACCDLPSITIPLLSVRRFGHLEGSFFFELGRSVPIGPGEIWLEAKDQGNPAMAQHIHEVVRDAVRELRVLPDFSRSPVSNHGQLLVTKRCRPRYREKSSQGRLSGSAATHTLLDVHAQSDSEPCKPNPTEPPSPLRQHGDTVPERDGYMDMMRQLGGEDCKVTFAAVGEEEGRGYMMMSPQASRSTSTVPRDDYVVMASPQKDQPASISHQTSNKCHPMYTPDTSSQTGHLPPPFAATSPQDSRLIPTPTPAQTCPLSAKGRSRPLQTQQLTGRRSRLSCLLSCLQADH
ncbi:insulin receptor substrate 4-like isoform X2 [Nerophis ophidion]|nr:insulin receptor substrate 4-like isoform X2 [Nerophis ophidion]